MPFFMISAGPRNHTEMIWCKKWRSERIGSEFQDFITNPIVIAEAFSSGYREPLINRSASPASDRRVGNPKPT